MDSPVGILGATAAGLALACGLAHFGVESVVYDEGEGPGEDLQPTTLGSRSLEGLDRWGLVPALKARGRAVRRLRLLYRGETRGFLPTSELATRFPYLLSLTRGDLCAGLEEAARQAGRVQLRRGRAVRGLRARGGVVEVLLDGGAVGRHRFLAATTPEARRLLAIPLQPGRAFPTWSGRGQAAEEDAFDLHLGPSGMARSHPGTGRVALEAWSEGADLLEVSRDLGLPEEWDLRRDGLPEEAGLADPWRAGPVVLLGPAARTLVEGAWKSADLDVGEAENLAWKLPAVLAGAPEALLDSYELERRAPAGAAARRDLLARLCQPRAMRWLAPLLRASFVRKALGEWAAGLKGRYPASPWCRSEGSRGGPPGAGARLPEVRYQGERGRRLWLQDLLGRDPLVLRFGPGGEPHGRVVSREPGGTGVLHDPDGSVARALAGRPGTVIVVRPDGVVGYRACPERPGATAAWLGGLSGAGEGA